MSGNLRQAIQLLLLCACVTVLALLVWNDTADAQSPPPAFGDWTVADNTTYNLAITLHANLVVKSGGRLDMNGGNITFDCTKKGEFSLIVEAGGTLIAQNCNFQPSNLNFPFNFKLQTNSKVDISYCTIRGVGNFNATIDTWGIYIHSSDVTISNSKITQCNVGAFVHASSPVLRQNNISGNNDRAIWCKFGSPLIDSNRLYDNSYGIYLENDSLPQMMNNEFQNNRREAIWMDISSRANWTVNQPVYCINASALVRGNITIATGGYLELSGSTIQLGGNPSDIKAMTVKSGGTLLLLARSTITAAQGSTAFAFAVEPGGNLTMNASSVTRAGLSSGGNLSASGIYIAGMAQISNSNLSGNYASLICNGSTTAVTNTSLEGIWLDCWMRGAQVSFTNVSYLPQKLFFDDAVSTLEVAWYLSSGMLWQNGQGVAGASLTVTDGKGTSIYSGSAGPDGYVRYIRAVQLKSTKTGSTDFSPHSLLARVTGLSDQTKTVTMSSNRDITLIFTDPEPPALVIVSPENNSAINRSQLTATGNCTDNMGISKAELKLDDSYRWNELSYGEWNYTITNLVRGDHRITVRVTDHSGLVTSTTVMFTVDTEMPRLSVDVPFDDTAVTAQEEFEFKGSTEPLVTLKVGGNTAIVQSDGSFSCKINLSEGLNEITVTAQDRAGNAISIVKKLTRDTIAPQILITYPSNNTKTKLSELTITGIVEPGTKFQIDGRTVELDAQGKFNHTLQLFGGLRMIELLAQDRAGNSNSVIFHITKEGGDTPGGGQGFFARYGIFIIIALVAVIAAAVGTAFVMRRKQVILKTPPVKKTVDGQDVAKGRSVDELLYGDQPGDDEPEKAHKDEPKKPAVSEEMENEEDIPEAPAFLAKGGKNREK